MTDFLGSGVSECREHEVTYRGINILNLPETSSTDKPQYTLYNRSSSMDRDNPHVGADVSYLLVRKELGTISNNTADRSLRITYL